MFFERRVREPTMYALICTLVQRCCIGVEGISSPSKYISTAADGLTSCASLKQKSRIISDSAFRFLHHIQKLKRCKSMTRCGRRDQSSWCERTHRVVCRCARRCARQNNRVGLAASLLAGVQCDSHRSKSVQR